MTRIGLIGAQGRMGAAIMDEAAAAGAILSGGLGRNGPVLGPHADLAALVAASDVLVDFSVPDALPDVLEAAVAAGVSVLVGTTGLTSSHHDLLDRAAGRVAVLQAANTSLGINLLARLVREAAARLGPDWDVEVLEMHHRHKTDAPSGTARLLGTAAAAGRGVDRDGAARIDRAGAREVGTIGYAVMRGGSVAGDHMVVLAGEGERLELGHRAESRAIFARGAVRAALWLAGRPAGRYTMDDVLAA